jgi:hypothetical protein
MAKKNLFVIIVIFSNLLHAQSIPQDAPLLTQEIIEKSFIVRDPNKTVSIVYDENDDFKHILKWVLKEKKIVRITIESLDDSSYYLKWVYDDSFRLDKKDDNNLESFVKLENGSKFTWENKENLAIPAQTVDDGFLNIINNKIK